LRVLMPPSKPPGPAFSSTFSTLRCRSLRGRSRWVAQNLAFSSDASTVAEAFSQATQRRPLWVLPEEMSRFHLLFDSEPASGAGSKKGQQASLLTLRTLAE